MDAARETEAAERSAVGLARAGAAAVQARERLAALIGVQDMGPWILPADFAQPPAAEPPLAQLEETALRQRWDLDAARREPTILKDELTLNRVNLFGPVSAGFDAEKGIGERPGSGPAVEFSLPLFNQRLASSARIKARMRQSALTVAALEAQARLDVRTAYSELTAAREVADRYQTALLPLSQTVAQETLKNYDFMLLGVYDVLRARREQFEAQADYIDALRDYWTARAELERALGGVIPAEPAPVPQQGEKQ